MTVYLVGAGPGDPGLLTRRGAEVLGRADVVIFDRLSVASLLDLAPPAAERISVGKAPGGPSVPQAEINRLLVERGRSDATVVRLKGGDPFVFARGGEEARALGEAGVAFEVVPGITAAIAAPAYAGVPVTLRHSSTSFTVVTGHEDPSVAEEGRVDWDAVARVGGTIVVLMGVGRRAAIAAALMKGGRPPETPVAAIRWGTRPEQETVRTTLDRLGATELAAPTTIVIGDVAAEDLSWFDNRPLTGRRVVVTRAAHQAESLMTALRDAGAVPIAAPAIRLAPPADGGAGLRAAAAELHRFSWVVCTSANGARRLLEAVGDVRGLGGTQVAAIGPATAAVFEATGITPDLVPAEHVGEGLGAVFPAPERPNHRVLLARAAAARAVVPDALEALGWTVEMVDAYRTEPADIPADVAAAVAEADTVTFTSASTVHSFVDQVGVAGVPTTVACIGPVTAAAARDHGLTVAVEADPHTADGLVSALTSFVAG